MKIGDIWKNKNHVGFIRIDAFATDINGQQPMIIVCSKLQMIDDNLATIPSCCIYGSQEDIEQNYELYIDEKDLDPVSVYDYIDMIKKELGYDNSEEIKEIISKLKA